MNDLVNMALRVIGVEEVNSVNARDIWEFVESKQEFSHWVKDRIKDFTEGVDFIVDKNSPNIIKRIE